MSSILATLSACAARVRLTFERLIDRKSTRLNSSHLVISDGVFCFKKPFAADDGRPVGRCAARRTGEGEGVSRWSGHWCFLFLETRAPQDTSPHPPLRLSNC